ncbi:RidA family protein [soil metagenome]
MGDQEIMNAKRSIVESDSAPAAIGPYSQAVKAGNLLFTSGQIPVNPATTAIVDGGIQEQAHQVLKNLTAVLEASGSSLANALRTTCFMKDLDDFAAFNEVYASYFDSEPPARSTVQVARLPLDVLIEIDCVALIG